MPSSDATTALEKAAEGLTYQSETDAPWTVFRWPAAQGEPNAQEVRQLGKQKPKAPVAELSLDDFFTPLVQEQDWYGDEEKATAARYKALLDAVKQHLGNAKVFQVGSRKTTVYVVGKDTAGGWAGLKTTAVET